MDFPVSREWLEQAAKDEEGFDIVAGVWLKEREKEASPQPNAEEASQPFAPIPVVPIPDSARQDARG